ncbi:MAG TPA: sensor N-terminal transmembrane domain-containing protein, partial [Croceibacterium sp.]
MADNGPWPRTEFFKHPWRFSHRLSLTTRILAVNILPLALLGGGIFYLDSYRKQLLSERYQLARIEAQITAEALAGATRERQDAVLTEIGKEQHMRVRTFDPQGRLEADSFRLDKPTFAFDVVGDEDLQERVARWLDRAVNWIVGADPIP